MDENRLRDLYDQPLDWRHKSIPAAAHGLSLREWLAGRPHTDDLETPSVVLSGPALDHNLEAMAAWCGAHGLDLAPHGKATMAPQLWRRQLAAGAVGVTVANAFQAGVAHAFGAPMIMVANEVADPGGAARLAAIAASGTRVVVFADAPDAVAILARAATAPIEVAVELGAPGGRAGARTADGAADVAALVRAAPNLRLTGVAGYEGAVTAGTDAAALEAVDDYLRGLADLYAALDFETDRPIVTAGGSAYFDRVAAVLSGLDAAVVLRSGSYLIHDHGAYARWTPAARGGDGPLLRPTLTASSRVLARPEPGLAILDAGRRDVPFDQDLPVPLGIEGASCPQISDQHLFLAGAPDHLAVGDAVRLGLSHPCTSFDKWRLIPVADADGAITDAVATFF